MSAGPGDHYTHAGDRYLLGRDRESVGIWMRGAEEHGPVRRYPATNEGWGAALGALHDMDVAVVPLQRPPSGLSTSPYYVPPPGYGYPPAPAQNGPGVAGGIVGIVGAVLSLIPLAGIFIGIPLGVVAVVLGGVGLARPLPAPKGMAVTGLVLGALTVVFKLIPGVDLL